MINIIYYVANRYVENLVNRIIRINPNNKLSGYYPELSVQLLFNKKLLLLL